MAARLRCVATTRRRSGSRRDRACRRGSLRRARRSARAFARRSRAGRPARASRAAGLLALLARKSRCRVHLRKGGGLLLTLLCRVLLLLFVLRLRRLVAHGAPLPLGWLERRSTAAHDITSVARRSCSPI